VGTVGSGGGFPGLVIASSSSSSSWSAEVSHVPPAIGIRPHNWADA